MTPGEFIAKWRAAELKERSSAQEHFIDLCRMLGEPTPADVDPKGEWYAFERGATKTTGGEGWADVWKRGHFGWEYKGKRKDLNAAFVQLQQYAIALENPPLLVVSDIDRIIIRTNWTNSVSAVHEIGLDDLRDASVRDKLKAVLSNPEQLRPGKTRESLTRDAAGEFAELAKQLREKGHQAETVAHFINRLVFCMFAEDIGLLPNQMFSRMLDHAKDRPDDFVSLTQSLFAAMRTGGRIGFEPVDWFNGGLFDDDTALPLDRIAIATTIRAARLDWSEIDPSIFGTLFERGLDPDKRSQLGAHYTDRDKIMMIVEPVIVRPWLSEWDKAKPEISDALAKAEAAATSSARTRAKNTAVTLYRAFLDRLRAFTILDPACGSGNFLYLGLLALKDLEHRVMIEAEAMGLDREFPRVGPQNVKGIEINPFAAELARVTVWIGEIQWMRKNGFSASRDPILKPLDNIECRDALMNPDGSEAYWPSADALIGNPPFLGGKKIRSVLGDDYIARLFSIFEGRVPREADLVTYWVEKGWRQVLNGQATRASLVTTNSIRAGANRRLLDPIAAKQALCEVWSDEPWILDGAAVRVSIVGFGSGFVEMRLNGNVVGRVNSELTSTIVELTAVHPLKENRGVSYQGNILVGEFDVTGDQARSWLLLPRNPNGRPNSDVLRPWSNATDVTRRPSGRWVIDFGVTRSEHESALYEVPFHQVLTLVKPKRDRVRRVGHRQRWWLHGEARPGMRRALGSLGRYIVTPRVAKFRLFVWFDKAVLPDTRLVVIAKDDDTTFGILQSGIHEAWSLATCSWHGVGNDPTYNGGSVFETFPFPNGLTPNIPAADYAADPRAIRIGDAAKRLNELRENWLNPADLVKRVPEVVPGYPDRILPMDEKAEKLLKQRTLTKLYNERPAWLDHAHRELDAAVAAAYGWAEDVSDEDVLARLFALNQERSPKEIVV